ncbi:MAG: metalloregulator ArsR/SmtB family transcription factor [Thaumarchaeota archaeon]|jgi:DNA-binding transcriptional ArsR family regulator|nr:metalloregulator ArsR/SmtB family transcription factor [Candidatus Geocrenenecus arthurdayi]
MSKGIRLAEIIDEMRRAGKCRFGEELPVEADRVIETHIEGLDEVAYIFKHLAEPNKFKILLLLYINGPLPVCIISHVLNLDQTLTSHHLRSLRKAGLVEYERKGKFKFYKLTNTSQKLLDAILTVLEKK